MLLFKMAEFERGRQTCVLLAEVCGELSKLVAVPAKTMHGDYRWPALGICWAGHAVVHFVAAPLPASFPVRHRPVTSLL